MYNINILKNGARLIALHMPHMESISVGFLIGAGGRFEEEQLSGISHFLEHLLFKGTKKRTALEITQMIEGAGGSLNAFTSQEYTCYFAKVLKNKFSIAIDILSDMFLNAVLKPEDIERERKIILEELHMGMDTPSHHVIDILDSILWPNHQLGRRLIGTEESLRRIQLEEIVNYKKDYYLPSQTVIAIAGNLNGIDYKEILEKCFSSTSQKKEFPVEKFVSRQVKPHVSFFEKNTEQTHAALGIRSYPRGDKHRFALRLLNIILGGNMSSRLFQTVREKYGLSYDINSSVESFIDTGVLVVSAGLDNSRIKEAISCIIDQLRRLKKEYVTAKELSNAKEYSIGRLLLMNEKTTSQMMYAGEQLLCLGEVMPVQEIIKKFEQLSEKDIRNVAEEIFDITRLSLALIGPIKSIDEIQVELDLS